MSDLTPGELANVDQIVASVSEHGNNILRAIAYRFAAIAEKDDESVQIFTGGLFDALDAALSDPVVGRHVMTAFASNLVQAMSVHANLKAIELEHEIAIHGYHPMGPIHEAFEVIQLRETRFNCDPNAQSTE